MAVTVSLSCYIGCDSTYLCLVPRDGDLHSEARLSHSRLRHAMVMPVPKNAKELFLPTPPAFTFHLVMEGSIARPTPLTTARPGVKPKVNEQSGLFTPPIERMCESHSCERRDIILVQGRSTPF